MRLSDVGGENERLLHQNGAPAQTFQVKHCIVLIRQHPFSLSLAL